MKLWIDAVRDKPTSFDYIARSVKEAKQYIAAGQITEISINFDNTAYDDLFSWMKTSSICIPIHTHLNNFNGTFY